MAKQYVVTEVDGKKVKLSNLSKVLYPDQGILKAEIIQYYMAVGPTFLKYIENRPLSLVRYPDGINAHKFYTKEKPDWAPSWIESILLGKGKEKEGKNYILADNQAAVIWLANLACLDIHPMQVKKPNYDKPDLIVFDLDPPPNAVFGSIKAVAFNLKKYLEEFGYYPFIKTSGGKGVHVCVPIAPLWKHDELMESIKTLTRGFIKLYPEHCTLKIQKTARTNKMLIDIYRNHEGQTTVGAYSTRGRPGATVSMPITWDQLEDLEHPSIYTIKNVPDLLKKHGDAWKGFRSYAVHLHDKRGAQPSKMPETAVGDQLQSYEGKRDFSKTSEPAPESTVKTKGNRFVIQIHHATNLHWDLRLEMNGVLRSWAIPKGLPPVPGIKRLAIETEPHPLKYLDFEGVIPKEEYGGGTMWVFATGTYEVSKKEEKRMHVKLISKQVEATFHLYKMKNNEWLIERKDNPTYKLLQDVIPPMLAIPQEKLPKEKDFSYEIKWDGIRAVMTIADKQVTIRSRSGRDITKQFPKIADSKHCRSATAILDGEIVCLDEAGKPVFTDVISRLHTSAPSKIDQLTRSKPAYFYVFDCLYLGGRSLMSDPLHKRQEWLAAIIRKNNIIRLSEGIEDGKALLEAAKLHGLEGIIAKKTTSSYHPGGRSGDWLKIKFRSTAECVILGYTKGEGARKAFFGALHLGEISEEGIIYKGKVGTGFDDKKIKAVLETLEGLNRSTKLIKDQISDEKSTVWLEPILFCEIQYASLTNKSTYREPVFMRLRPDLSSE